MRRRELEYELGTALILRTSAGLRLTEAGERFYPHARHLLEEITALGSTVPRDACVCPAPCRSDNAS